MRGWLFFLVRIFCYPSWWRFYKAIRDPEKAQMALALKIHTLTRKTQYGAPYADKKVHDLKSFQGTYPLTRYEQIEPLIKNQRGDDHGQICPGKVIGFEPTSGSQGDKKLIPYNRALLKSFTVLFKIWAYDWLKNGPCLRYGKIWFSISFADQDEASGLKDDSHYLLSCLRPLLRPFLAVDLRLRFVADPREYFLILSCFLIRCRQLEVMSLWNPSFLLEVLSYMAKNRLDILSVLKQGSYYCQGMTFQLKISRDQLARFEAGCGWDELWPNLKIISVWDNAHAGMGALKIRQLFPGTKVQGKGLLATEAPLSLPLLGVRGHIPLFHEVLFEFRNRERILGLLEVEKDQVYELIISQKGGLIRYELGDQVKVVGFYGHIPLLEFVGRVGDIVDLVGEKLSLKSVQGALEGLGYKGDYLLLPFFTPRPHYLLLVSEDLCPEEIEVQLQGVYHYQLARRLAQLDPVRVLKVKDFRSRYEGFLQRERQMKRGDIKHSFLIKSPTIAASFWRSAIVNQ